MRGLSLETGFATPAVMSADNCTFFLFIKNLMNFLINFFSTGILCGGSNTGNVTIWKKNSTNSSMGDEWEELSTTKMKEKISYSTWGFQNCAILSGDSLFVLQEHELCSQYNKKVKLMRKFCKFDVTLPLLSVSSIQYKKKFTNQSRLFTIFFVFVFKETVSSNFILEKGGDSEG